MSNETKIQWHDAFFAALQLELYEYKDKLIFESEHQLSQQPLRLDVLIVKKTDDVQIKKNIGQIFLKHNIFEYKSETDNLTIWDYMKVMGYAMLYCSFEEVLMEEATVSFVVTPLPKKLFKYLKDKRGLEINEVQQGVYYITGDVFPVQVIETKKLSDEENLFLQNLQSNVSLSNMATILSKYNNHDSNLMATLLRRVADANVSIFEEAMSMTAEVKRRIIINLGLEEEFITEGLRKGQEQGLLQGLEQGLRKGQEQGLEQGLKQGLRKGQEQGLEQGREENQIKIAQSMLQRGYAIEEISAVLNVSVEWIENL